MRVLFMLTPIRCLDIIYLSFKTKMVNGFFVQESSIAKIVCHHDGRIQRAEIERSDWDIVISFLGLNDCGSLILLIRAYTTLENRT